MKTIEITSQAQLDGLPDSFSEYTEIHIKSGTVYSPIIVRKARGSSHVAVRDLHAWDGGDYPHKIAFRAGVVLHECDRYGKKIEQKGK